MKCRRRAIGVTWILTLMLVLSPLMLKAAAPKKDDEEAQIAALKKQLAQQNQRISELESEVHALLAAAKISPGPPAKNTTEANVAARPTAPLQAATKELSGKDEKTAGDASVPAPPAVSQAMTRKSDAATTPKITVAGIHVGGDVYLFQYAPVGVPGAQPRFELYAFSTVLDGQYGHWGFHSDYRLRTTPLRSFFPGVTWLQQGYVRYDTPYGEFRAGSFYRRVGLDWDGSFFGNIEYFDGLLLDPEFGVDFQGSHDFSSRLGAQYSAQYFSTDARINGSLPGRDFVSEAGAHAKNDLTLRLAPVFKLGRNTSLTIGGSLAHGAIDRDLGPNNTRDQFAADATLQTGPLLTYGEILRQDVLGPVVLPPWNATYALAGVRWDRGRFQPRFNFSQGDYLGLDARREYILQPGITVRLADGFSFIYEYDFWRDIAPSSHQTLDRSLDMVLDYHF
jgi:hypothetical protein